MRKAILISLALFLLAYTALAQRNQRRPANFNSQRNQAMVFLEKQWWLGFKAGFNLAEAVPESRYHVVAPVNYPSDVIEKQYDNFVAPGFQATFEVAFSFREWSISAQPTYRTAHFVYTNHYRWSQGKDARYSLELDYEQRNQLGYLDFPLVARYEFPLSGIRPYLMAGIYASRLIDADKEVTVRGVDHASGGENRFEQEPIMVGARDLFAKNHWGLVGGAGIFYNLGNIRLNLDVAYRQGMSNIASTSNRFKNDRLTGVGDAMDDARLHSIAISLGCLFPLRFLQSGFRSMPN